MAMSEYSLSDLAAASGNNSGFGGAGGIWLLIILFFLIGMGGNGFGNNGLNQYATAASQQEILFGQRFDQLGQKINSIGDGICSSTYALNNSINGVQAALGTAITTEGRSIQAQLSENKYDAAMQNAATQQAIHAEGEATRNMLQQNKIEALQAQINQLTINQAMCGVVRYPTSSTYTAGGNPFCGCNCNAI